MATPLHTPPQRTAHWTPSRPGEMTVGFGPHYNTVGVIVMPIVLFIALLAWFSMGSPEARKERAEAEKAQAGVERSKKKQKEKKQKAPSRNSTRGKGWLSPRKPSTSSMLSATPAPVLPSEEQGQHTRVKS